MTSSDFSTQQISTSNELTSEIIASMNAQFEYSNYEINFQFMRNHQQQGKSCSQGTKY